ncbi:AAA family ATPase [Nocardiopsis sp. EMB25]|uniref:AAA family ATPase n=1 Tax=Nocardiopsis sp. EMB25 TaxID=2835867 RepID=UPI00228421E6|nr:AAA family ATPase [Nocardiopsis sp. EMB25]MCY9786509.1 AAA family ATPase [Nocardiopsis sp. EMB25]
MAHQEQNGPDRSPGTGRDPHDEERAEPLWEPPPDVAEGDGDIEGESGPDPDRLPPTSPDDISGPALSASAPSPREQWFGGFEVSAPPPPPYARLPETTPPAESARSDPEEAVPEDPEPGEPAAEGRVADEAGRAPGDAEDAQGAEEEPPTPRERPRRPLRPGRIDRSESEGPDPLAPRRLRPDPDVPEPEQLPPLEAETSDPPALGTAPDTDGAITPWRPTPPSLTGPRAAAASPTRHPEPDTGGRPGEDGRETSDSLNAATLVRNRRQGPSGGWRKAVHTATLGLVNPGESARVLRQRELVARACTPVASGHHRVAVLSLKGGVGKTTTSVALGATLASLRGDRVLAVDANPDRGTLSDKVRLETAATIRDLLNERHLVSRYADIRGFTSQAPSRLEILASDRDPAVSEAFSEDDYREVARIVEHFYSICITDCGTGLLHSAMRGVLGLADQVVLVSSASVDGARSASATLDWLEAHGHMNLVRGAVVVLSMVRSNSRSSVDLGRLEEHFSGRCRSVVRVPWDGHLEEGAEVDLDQLSPATRDAYLCLAAGVGEGFARRG